MAGLNTCAESRMRAESGLLAAVRNFGFTKLGPGFLYFAVDRLIY
jgi:hypothetical protein